MKLPNPVPVENERALIASALLDPSILDESEAHRIQPDHFGDAARAAVWEAILSLHHRPARVSGPTVVDELRAHDRLDRVGGEAAIFDLESEFPDTGAADQYANRVMNGSKLRKASSYWRKAASGSWAEFDEVSRRISAVAADLEGDGESIEDAHISTALDGAEEIFGSPIRTGLQLWDEHVPLYPGRFLIIAAPSGHGKSALAGDLVLRAAANQQAAMISLFEMKRREFATRSIAAASGVPQRQIISRDPAVAHLVESSRESLREAPIWVYNQVTDTVEGFAAKCRRLHREAGLRLAVADYIQIMAETPTQERRNREQALAHIGRSLKRLAAELDITVIGVSQLNESGKTRESRSLTNDADVVVRLKNRSKLDSEENHPSSPEECTIIDVDLPKVRYAAGRSTRLAFNGPNMRFSDR